MSKTILLVDGDTVAYRSAAVTEKREVEVTHVPTGKTKMFKTRTAFKERLQEKNGNLDLSSDYIFKDIQTPEPLANALQATKSVISKLHTAIEPDESYFFIGGKNNFRELLPLPTRYKGNRDTMLRPILLDEVKQYIIKKYKAESPDGIEADDAIIIKGYEELRKGNKVIIASNDKDTLQSEGLIMFDYTKENPKLVSIPDIGEITLKGNECKGAGLKFFAYQLVCGDTTDNYKPTEVCSARFGATGAFKLFKDLNTKYEILEAVVQKYKEWYGDLVEYKSFNGIDVVTDWKGMLDLYFQCAYMKRSKDDTSDWKKFFSERGWSE